MEERKGGRMDGRKDGWMDGRKEGRKKGRKHLQRRDPLSIGGFVLAAHVVNGRGLVLEGRYWNEGRKGKEGRKEGKMVKEGINEDLKAGVEAVQALVYVAATATTLAV